MWTLWELASQIEEMEEKLNSWEVWDYEWLHELTELSNQIVYVASEKAKMVLELRKKYA